MSEFFPKPKSSGANLKVELDLSNYAIKTDLKNATGLDTSKFAKNADLASSKSEIKKLDIGKSETTPVDLNKLSDVVKNEVVKKIEYNELVKKVNAIQNIHSSNLVKKTDDDSKIVKI